MKTIIGSILLSLLISGSGFADVIKWERVKLDAEDVNAVLISSVFKTGVQTPETPGKVIVRKGTFPSAVETRLEVSFPVFDSENAASKFMRRIFRDRTSYVITSFTITHFTDGRGYSLQFNLQRSGDEEAQTVFGHLNDQYTPDNFGGIGGNLIFNSISRADIPALFLPTFMNIINAGKVHQGEDLQPHANACSLASFITAMNTKGFLDSEPYAAE